MKNLYGVREDSIASGKQSTDSRCSILKTLEDTIAFGAKLMHIIPDLKLLLLEGSLGAGKTSLVKGIAISLGINEPITSPTFPLVQQYNSGKPPLVHLDLYRLEDHKSANELFIQEEEEAKAHGALVVVEWPERLKLPLPEAWKLKLEHHLDGRLAHLLPPSISAKKAITSS